MAAKVDPKVYARICDLKERFGLQNVIIATRLGLSPKTVRIYLKQRKDELASQISPNHGI
jgi:predicted transcriptional regulator